MVVFTKKWMRQQLPCTGPDGWISSETHSDEITQRGGQRLVNVGRDAVVLGHKHHQLHEIGKLPFTPRWVPRRHLQRRGAHAPNVRLQTVHVGGVQHGFRGHEQRGAACDVGFVAGGGIRRRRPLLCFLFGFLFFLFFFFQRFRRAKICQFDLSTVRHQYVGTFDVAVPDVVVVQVQQTFQCLVDVRPYYIDGQRAKII